MNPRTALTIGAALAALFGAALVFAPQAMLAGMGLGAPPEGIVLSRNLGAMLFGVSILNWLSRDFSGEAVRAVLIGNLAIQSFELLVNGADIVAGTLPSKAAGGLVLHVLLMGLYAAGLWGAARSRASSEAPV